MRLTASSKELEDAARRVTPETVGAAMARARTLRAKALLAAATAPRRAPEPSAAPMGAFGRRRGGVTAA